MKIRKIVSLTALLSFLLLGLSGVILYLTPHGRVAYWADWRLWGMSKTQWGNLHTNAGFLFIIFSGLHIYYNWRPLVSYLKSKAKKIKVFTPEFNVALLITTVITVGTLLEAPPFVWIQDLGESIKEKAITTYGEPPYGHAELSSLTVFSAKMGYDISGVEKSLKARGVAYDSPEQSIEDIAKKNGMSPQQLFDIFKQQDSGLKKGASLPENPPAGIGNLTLKEICLKVGASPKNAAAKMTESGIEASPDMTIKQIAAANSKAPPDVYESLRKAVQALSKGQPQS